VLDRAVAIPEPAVAVRLGFAMWRFWQKHGHLAEARRRLERMDAADWSRDDPRLRAKLLEALGGVCWWQADIETMERHYREALELWQGLGDEAELANAYYNESFVYAIPADRTKRLDEGDPGRPDHLTRARLPQGRKRRWRGQRRVGPRELPVFPQPPGPGHRGIPRGA
jgi:hypothetical protein